MPCEVVGEHAPHIGGDARHPAIVAVVHGRLAVRVGVEPFPRADDPVVMLKKIKVRMNARLRGYGSAEPFLLFGQSLLAGMLLQDDEVAAHFRVRAVCKKIVRQAQRRYQIRTAHHFRAHGFIARCIHHALRSDERHEAAFAYRIQPFQEEVVVNALGGCLPCRLPAARIVGIEDRHVAERDSEAARSKVPRNGFSMRSNPSMRTFCPG